MKEYIGVTALWAMMAISAQAISPEVQKSFDEFIQVLRQDRSAAGLIRDGSEDRLQYDIQNLRRYIDDSSSENQGRNLNEYQINLPGEKSVKAYAALKDAVETDRKSQQARQLKVLLDRVESIKTVLKNSTVPEDIDDLLQGFQSNYNSDYARNGKLNLLSAEDSEKYESARQFLSSARNFLTSWQDYLQAKKNGDLQSAYDALSRISSESNVLPRSVILNKLEELKKSAPTLKDLVTGINSLKDIRPGLLKLDEYRKNSGQRGLFDYNSGLNEVYTVLQKIDKQYQDFQVGLPLNLEIFSAGQEPNLTAVYDKIASLRVELLKLTLPRVLQLGDDYKAQADETVNSYLERVIRIAGAKKDIAASKRIIEFTKTYYRTSSLFGMPDQMAVQEYNAAVSHMEAKRYMVATYYFEKALSRGSDFLPNEQIGQLLAKIQKETPAEYDSGMKAIMDSAVQQPESMRFQMDPRFGNYGDMMMRGWDQRAYSNNFLIPIPGKSAATGEGITQEEEGKSPPELRTTAKPKAK